jgi:hypothetical protein
MLLPYAWLCSGEGVLDSFFVGHLGQWLMQIEEEFLEGGDYVLG